MLKQKNITLNPIARNPQYACIKKIGNWRKGKIKEVAGRPDAAIWRTIEYGEVGKTKFEKEGWKIENYAG